jgi:hypothetical protein
MDCRYFDGCSAPLCPKDKGAGNCSWFPDEDICRLADVPEWVKRQKRVSRKAVPGGYFTLAMLKQDCRISKGMKGVDPDGTDAERAADEAAWFKAHPAITDDDREKMRVRGQKQTAVLSRYRREKAGLHQGLEGVSGKRGI